MENCLTYALRKWITEGGYFITRKSLVGWWPHFLHSHDLKTFTHYVPKVYKTGLLFPPLFFDGFVKTGDLGAHESHEDSNESQPHKNLPA